MHLWRHVAIVAVSLLATGAIDTARAWQHTFHERVARISRATMPAGHVPIDWEGVFVGTRDPDSRRDDCPWLNSSHKKDHWRIQSSTDAAVKTLRDHGDPKLAGRRLGRAFHYLQDQTEVSDATKARFASAFPKSDFRTLADQVLASIETVPGGPESGRLSFSADFKDRTQAYGGLLEWTGILDAVEQLRKDFDQRMTFALNSAPDHVPTIKTFHWYFASLVALQNQIVRLYAKDLSETKEFLDKLAKAPPPRPYGPKPEGPACAGEAAPWSAQCTGILQHCVADHCKVPFSDCRNHCGSCAGHVVAQTFSDYWCRVHPSYLPAAKNALASYIGQVKQCVDMFLAGQLKEPFFNDQKIGFCTAPHAKAYEERWSKAVADACSARCASDGRKGVVKRIPHRCECE